MSEKDSNPSENEKNFEGLIKKLNEVLNTFSIQVRDTIVYLGRLRESIQATMDVLKEIETVKIPVVAEKPAVMEEGPEEKLEEKPKVVPKVPAPPQEEVPTSPSASSNVTPPPIPPKPTPPPPAPAITPAPVMPKPAPPTSTSRVTVPATKMYITEELNRVLKLAEEGTSARALSQELLSARDKIMQKVPYSPAYHEMRMFAQKLKDFGEGPIPSSVFSELYEKIEDWKRRLSS